MNTKDEVSMKKMVRGIFVLSLCILMVSSMNMVKGRGGLQRNGEVRQGRSKYFFYVDQGKTNDICYISYHIEVRRGSREDRGDREVTIVHIVRK